MKKTIPLFIIFALLSLNFTIAVESGKERDSLYEYHTNYPGTTGDYAWLVSDMQNLNSSYPEIFELYTAQDKFGLPDVVHGSEVYKTWIIRITNESTGFNKPEVLFIGGHHGDEKVGVETAYYLAEWLAEHYYTDEWIRYLVDHREIYIMPLANPYGWVHHQRYDENGVDMNRDYPYDPSSHIFSTIGARAIHELTRRHLFINTVSWHGGTEMIIYAWGCYAHTGNTESPDDVAFYNQGKYMSQYAGSYSGYYIWGRSNDILYPCYGAYEDYAYAMSWDLPNADPNWPTNGCRSLTHCVEISSSKYPPESTLGGRADVYTPGGDEDGYVPKNIRLALLLTDIAEPYIKITNNPPVQIYVGENVTFEWKVMGALNTTETNILYGTDPDPIKNYSYSTPIQSGGTGWDNVTYSQNITISQPGDYYFVVRAKVDQNMLNQNNPDPAIPPQSLYVNMRTNDSWSISNYNNTLEGRSEWYSEVIHIHVISNEISFNFSLAKGWNLITLPVENNYTASSLLANIPECSIILSWNSSMQDFDLYIPGSPNDFEIENGTGYLIGIENDTSFNITGIPIESVAVILHEGWNMLGWFKEEQTNASSLLTNITSCNIVLKWNSSMQDFELYAPGVPNDFAVKQGEGFLVAVSEQSIWHG